MFVRTQNDTYNVGVFKLEEIYSLEISSVILIDYDYFLEDSNNV